MIGDMNLSFKKLLNAHSKCFLNRFKFHNVYTVTWLFQYSITIQKFQHIYILKVLIKRKIYMSEHKNLVRWLCIVIFKNVQKL